MSILKRLEQAIASGRRAVGSRQAPDAARPRTAVFLTGMRFGELSPGQRQGVSVLITDSRDVSEYQLPGIATEYLAAPSRFPDRFPPDETLTYLVRRLAVLRVKWRIGRLYIAGEGASALADAWAVDPEGPRAGFIVPIGPLGKM